MLYIRKTADALIDKAQSICNQIDVPFGWHILVGTEDAPDAGDCTLVYLRVNAPDATCNFTGQPYPWKGRKFPLSVHMTEGEIVQTALLATLIAIEHETRELFKYKGKAIFNPHKDPLSGDVVVRDVTKKEG